MKKSSWCEKHLKIRRAVCELRNRSSHFNRTALYLESNTCFILWYLGDKDCGNDRRRPPVPKATDHIATPYRTRRNFVHKNALDAMLSEPPNAAGKDSSDSSDACYVDSPRGNTQVMYTKGGYFKDERSVGGRGGRPNAVSISNNDVIV